MTTSLASRRRTRKYGIIASREVPGGTQAATMRPNSSLNRLRSGVVSQCRLQEMTSGTGALAFSSARSQAICNRSILTSTLLFSIALIYGGSTCGRSDCSFFRHLFIQSSRRQRSFTVLAALVRRFPEVSTMRGERRHEYLLTRSGIVHVGVGVRPKSGECR